MNAKPSHADQIRSHLERVAELRQRAETTDEVGAVLTVKRLQATRFRATYSDFLARRSSAPAVIFFLEELYGAHDFSERDRQFARIAGALEQLFPASVAQLAVDLTEVHALTEWLDHDMARQWAALDPALEASYRYVLSWRACGERGDRLRQLSVVRQMGEQLQRLTRNKGLRLALRMMRTPARAAGLDALQRFLESGFDAFATMGDAGPFLSAIEDRESQWIAALFDEEVTACALRLRDEWSRARA